MLAHFKCFKITDQHNEYKINVEDKLKTIMNVQKNYTSF